LAVSKGDEELLLQNLDSLYIYEKADSDSGDRQLYRFVLANSRLEGFLSRSTLGGFFMRRTLAKSLTRSEL
jgi:hypothetical protein